MTGAPGGDPRGARVRYAALFAAESRELLTAAGAALAALGDAARLGAPPADAVDALFRAMHSLKGMAGAMDYAAVQALAHAVEGVLARARDRALALAPEHVDALVAAVDALDAAIDASIAGRAVDVAADVESLELLTAPVPAPRAIGACASPSVAALAPTPGTVVVHVRIAADTPLPGVRALLVVRRLEALGIVETAAPPVDALSSEAFRGAFAVRLRTDAAPDEVERAARAAGDVADARVETPRREPARREARDAHVRVERARLDALLDVAGELALARSRLAAAAAGVGDPALATVAAEVARLVGVLHEEVRSVRMSPAGEVFERLPRVVRDVARAVEKRAELVMEGGDVALDRAVLEELTEPLVHLLRNAVDHGLESPDERVAAGKPPVGRIVLRAARDRDGILVSVRDDGRGVDRARVAALAGAALAGGPAALEDDAELLALLARPGLTTAARVSAVSGRGVGIDAVRERVRRVGGTLAMETTPGEGTCFTMRLPLTLAVGRALVARIGAETYALPISQARETLEVAADAIERDGAAESVRVRDEPLPALRLADALGVASAGSAASDEEAEDLDGPPRVRPVEAVVLETAGRRAALLVDAIDGQQDVLVKPLPRLRGALPLFGGATILMDGTPALVLDAPALVTPAQAGPQRNHR